MRIISLARTMARESRDSERNQFIPNAHSAVVRAPGPNPPYAALATMAAIARVVVVGNAPSQWLLATVAATPITPAAAATAHRASGFAWGPRRTSRSAAQDGASEGTEGTTAGARGAGGGATTNGAPGAGDRGASASGR